MPDFVNEMVAWGAGPRAGIYLILAAIFAGGLYRLIRNMLGLDVRSISRVG